MAERSWCPSLGTQSDTSSPFAADVGFTANFNSLPLTEKSSAKRDAAVAANSGASADAISKTLATSFQRRFQKFDAAVVASNTNRLYWPSSSETSALQFRDALVPMDAVVCLDMQQLQSVKICTAQLAVLGDCISDILSLLARRSAKTSGGASPDSFTGLVALPSTSHVTSMSEIFSSLVSSKAFLDCVQQLTVCDASAGDGPTALGDFARSTPKLEVLRLINCSLLSDMSSLMEALKDREVNRLSLERCGIGCGSTDAEREAILASMAAYLKVNKFLLSLDLSYTNLDAEAVSSLMTALTESDTLMLPQEMSETPDLYDPSSLGERLNPADFLSTARKRSAGASEGDGAEADQEENADDESRASSQEAEDDAASEDATGNDDGDDDDNDNQEEDEENDDDDREEDGASKRRGNAAEKEQKLRERERLKAERQHQTQNRKEAKQMVMVEADARRALEEQYLAGLSETVTTSSAALARCYSDEMQKAKELHCTRRSGWSRLRALVLRGNRLGDSGAKQIALVLREEVPLSDDEVKQRQETADATREALGSALGAGRTAICVEEAQAWTTFRQMAQSELAKIGVHHNEAALVDGDAEAEEEDEYAKEAPPVVLTNVENRNGGGDGGEASPNDDGTEDKSAEEKRRWEAWAADGLPQVTVTPVKKGMRSVVLLDLGSCHIGKKGLQALAEVLRTNTVLESLCLRHNPIGNIVAKSAAAHQDAAGTMSAGFAAFAEMLCVNKTLRTLDLGYCQLGPHHVRTLATALRVNSGLVTLGLEGNQLGGDEGYQQKTHPHSYLYELWMAITHPESALRHLHMSHNSLALCLWSEEAGALAAVCGKLDSLALSHVGFEESHLQLWSEALQQGSGVHRVTVQELQLARNELAGETTGKVLGSILQHFTALEQLSLDDHPLLGSLGVAAALEFVPETLRRLSCGGTGLMEPFVGAAQSPVIPSRVAEQLTSLVLADVEATTADALGTWTAHLAESAHQIQYLSLWARGMAGKEKDVLPHFVDLARACPSLLYVDCGFQPQFRASASGAVCFVELEGILLPRRMSPPK